MHQEFYISVTPVREDEYLVRTEQVSPGVPLAEELVTWKVSDWLAEASQLMNDPLLGLLRGSVVPLSSGRTGISADSDAIDAGLSPSLVAFGQKLYNALFHGKIRDSWVTAQGIAQNRRDELRLRLGLKGDQLQRLPWEVLHAGNRPLATGTDVVFSRYQSNFTSPANKLQLHQNLGAEKTLRILMVLAAPTDQQVLQLEQEAQNLKQELQAEGRNLSSNSPPEIQLTILRQPGREQLTQELEHGQYHVLHYAGHSDLGASGGDMYLVSDRTGLTEVLGGDDLAGLLVNNGIRLAVFNSCRGVYAATSPAEPQIEAGNLADALLKRGIPAVLAMAERIPDDVALIFSRLFYRSLKQHHPIDLSLSRARQGLISSYSSNQLYWALPILYLHPDFDGYLQRSDPDRSGERSPVNLAPLTDSLQNTDSLFDFLEPDGLNDWDEEPDDSDRQAVTSLFQELLAQPTGGTPRSMTSGQGVRPREHTSSMQSEAPTGDLIERYLASGQQFYSDGDYAAAIAVYGEALKLDQQSAEVYHQLGMAFQAYNQPSEAATAFKMALRLDPTLATRQNLQQTATQVALGGADSTSARTDGSVGKSLATLPADASAKADHSHATPNWRKLNIMLPIGLVMVLITGGLAWGMSRFFAPESSLDQRLPQISDLPQPSLPSSTNLTKTNALMAEASRSFAQGDLQTGQKSVAALLDQQSLAAARQVLDSVPGNKSDQPDISFLRGRLAWQYARIKNRDFNIDDARRSWETAVKAKPDPLYYNMLGLALYSEGKSDQAGEAWLQALKLLESAKKTKATAPTSADALNSKSEKPSVEALNAYAGLALVAQKSAEKQTGEKRNSLRGEAVKLRDIALNNASSDFQPKQLRLGWRWSEVAIKDWERLLAVK